MCFLTACAGIRNTLSSAPLEPPFPRASTDDLRIYDAVIARIVSEYGQERDTIRVRQRSMARCEPNATVMYLDCLEERHYRSMETRWANGSWAFSGFIDDSTRRELAASFRARNTLQETLIGLDSSKIVTRTDAAMAAGNIARRGSTSLATIILARPGRTANSHAYVYAVFSRDTMTGARGAFATGIIFLLRLRGDLWEVVTTQGVWVT